MIEMFLLWLRWLLCGLLISLVACLSYQKIAYWQDRSTYQPTGRLVEVKGSPMHIDCRGERRTSTDPIVILEAGATLSAIGWSRLQDALSPAVRVCAYDRPGFGWSAQTSEPLDSLHISQALHSLLQQAGEAGPYIAVGHSLGGLFVRSFVEQYPADVAAVVLLDPVSLLAPAGPAADRFYRRRAEKLSALTVEVLSVHLGWNRVTDSFWQLKTDLPADALSILRAHYAQPGHIRSIYRQMLSLRDSVEQVAQTDGLASKPLLVLSAGTGSDRFRAFGIAPEEHENLASLSARGKQHVMSQADHYSLTMSPGVAPQTGEFILAWLAENTLITTGEEQPVAVLAH